MKIYNVNGLEEMTADIGKIVIYGHGVKLYETDNGQFEQCSIKANDNGINKVSSIYGGEVYAITLEKPIKRANKENLNRNDNYTLTYSPDYCRWEKRKALYIHESEINVTDLGLVLAFETEEEKQYLQTVKLCFKYPITVTTLHAEKIPCSGDWKIPDKGRWGSGYGTEETPCYDTYDTTESAFAKRHNIPAEKGVIKRWKTLDVIENARIICTERYYRKTEYSPERERKNAIAKALNDSKQFSTSFSHYDIDKLEKVLNITLKAI